MVMRQFLANEARFIVLPGWIVFYDTVLTIIQRRNAFFLWIDACVCVCLFFLSEQSIAIMKSVARKKLATECWKFIAFDFEFCVNVHVNMWFVWMCECMLFSTSKQLNVYFVYIYEKPKTYSNLSGVTSTSCVCLALIPTHESSRVIYPLHTIVVLLVWSLCFQMSNFSGH